MAFQNFENISYTHAELLAYKTDNKRLGNALVLQVLINASLSAMITLGGIASAQDAKPEFFDFPASQLDVSTATLNRVATFTHGVNDAGIVVGTVSVVASTDKTAHAGGVGYGNANETHAFLLENGKFSLIPDPVQVHPAFAGGVAINNRGQVLLSQRLLNGVTSYYLYDQKTNVSSLINIDGLVNIGGESTPFRFQAITGLNDKGEIVGHANGRGMYGVPSIVTPNSSPKSVAGGLYKVVALPCPGVTGGINNHSTVAGACSSGVFIAKADGNSAQLTEPADLKVPMNNGLAINDEDTVLGWVNRGAVSLICRNLICERFSLPLPKSINNKGLIVGDSRLDFPQGYIVKSQP